jgi:hypothetical protein
MEINRMSILKSYSLFLEEKSIDIMKPQAQNDLERPKVFINLKI